jgi:hypothetical protein
MGISWGSVKNHRGQKFKGKISDAPSQSKLVGICSRLDDVMMT